MYVNCSDIRTCTPEGVLRVISRAANFVMQKFQFSFIYFVSEEGFYGETYDSRPFEVESVYSVSKVQEDDRQGRPSGP